MFKFIATKITLVPTTALTEQERAAISEAVAIARFEAHEAAGIAAMEAEDAIRFAEEMQLEDERMAARIAAGIVEEDCDIF